VCVCARACVSMLEGWVRVHADVCVSVFSNV